MIELLDHSMAPLWEQYVEKHPHSTPYHRLYWRDVFQTAFGYEACHLVARSGDSLVGVLPLFRVRSFRGSFLVSIPFRDRGDPLSDDPTILCELILKAQELAREKKCWALLLKNIFELPEKTITETKLVSQQNWVRSYRRLENSKEDFWKSLNDKTRNMVRQGERAGLEFCSQEHYPANWQEGIDILRDTQHRLGIPPLPRPFYQQLLKRLSEEEAGQLCLVKHQGKPVAAAILLKHHKIMIYAYSGSRQEAWPYRVNDFLIWNCLVLALSEGFEYFDFGSDSQHQSELLFFKKKWGAEQSPVHYYYYLPDQPNLAPQEWRDSSQGIFPLLRNIVRRLPEPLYNLTGCFTRYFG